MSSSVKGEGMMKATIVILTFGALLFFVPVNSQAAIYSWFYIPHVAIGGGYTSYLTIRDPQGIDGRTVQVFLYADDGSPLIASVEGQGQNISSFSFTLGSFQEKSVAITGLPSTTTTGSIQIKASGIGLLNASLRFTTTDSSGNATDVVGILPAQPNFNWTVAVEKRSATDRTGIAIANPSTNPATVTLDLYQNGVRVNGTTSVTLPPLGSLAHTAGFVDQFVPGAWTSSNGIWTLRISSTAVVSVTALRADGNQYSSLPADAEAQWWNWSYTDSTGLTQMGAWSWRFTDGYSVIGFDLSGVPLRGRLDRDTNIFSAEWSYTNSDGTNGVTVFTGTLGKSGTTDVINGKWFQVRSDGTVIGAPLTFRATRTPPGGVVGAYDWP